MAGSLKLQLDVRAADGSIVSFIPSSDTRPALSEYLRTRGITDD